MNKSLVAASALAFSAAVVRTVDGESGPLNAARSSTMDPLVVGFFHITWYMVTALFLLAGIALFLSGKARGPGMSRLAFFIGAVFMAWSALIATVSSIFVWDIATVVPAVVTLAIGLLSMKGARDLRLGSAADP